MKSNVAGEGTGWSVGCYFAETHELVLSFVAFRIVLNLRVKNEYGELYHICYH